MSNTVIHILQASMHSSATIHNLMEQMVPEKKAASLPFNEQYQSRFSLFVKILPLK